MLARLALSHHLDAFLEEELSIPLLQTMGEAALVSNLEELGLTRNEAEIMQHTLEPSADADATLAVRWQGDPRLPARPRRDGGRLAVLARGETDVPAARQKLLGWAGGKTADDAAPLRTRAGARLADARRHAAARAFGGMLAQAPPAARAVVNDPTAAAARAAGGDPGRRAARMRLRPHRPGRGGGTNPLRRRRGAPPPSHRPAPAPRAPDPRTRCTLRRRRTCRRARRRRARQRRHHRRGARAAARPRVPHEVGAATENTPRAAARAAAANGARGHGARHRVGQHARRLAFTPNSAPRHRGQHGGPPM